MRYPEFFVKEEDASIWCRSRGDDAGYQVVYGHELGGAASIAHRVAHHLNRAAEVGRRAQRAEVRTALGITSWGSEVRLG